MKVAGLVQRGIRRGFSYLERWVTLDKRCCRSGSVAVKGSGYSGFLWVKLLQVFKGLLWKILDGLSGRFLAQSARLENSAPEVTGQCTVIFS